MTKRIDPDYLALKQCVKALNKSTSRRMLRANLFYLLDRYISHPMNTLPKHLRVPRAPSSGPRGAGKGGE